MKKYMETPTDISRGCNGYENTLERNWNGNVRFFGTPIVPSSLSELQEAVRNGVAPIRAVGRGHSFVPLCECSGGTLISLRRMNQVLDFEPPNEANKGVGSITIEGGTTYTEVAEFLGDRGALRNLPSCPQFTVAGAIATATHGSGVHIQNLSADVSAIEFVKADGSLVSYSQNGSPELLEGSRVHLGCLGIVSKLTLDVVPYYEVDTYCYTKAPLDKVVNHLPELYNSCDSLSVWTSGLGIGPSQGFCWLNFRYFSPRWMDVDGTSSIPDYHTRPHILQDAVLLDSPISRYCSDPGSLPDFLPTGKGPWYDKLSLTIKDGKETSMGIVDMQAEFFVPIADGQNAIRAVSEVARSWKFSPAWGETGERGFVDAMEFRQVKGDNGWISPHPVDSMGIHISFNGDPKWFPEITNAVSLLEKALQPFSVRAHWGKLAPLTFAPASVKQLYGENLTKFQKLCEQHDPTGKFQNAHVRHMLFG